jgi:hypothetical protein
MTLCLEPGFNQNIMNLTRLGTTGRSAILLALLAFNTAAGTLYVDLNNTNSDSRNDL